MANKYTFRQFQAQYPDDDACLDAIMQKRFGDKPTCPGCGVVETKFHRITGRRAYACQWCGHHVYPCAGTIFEKSSTKLVLWFHAMYLMTATRNGVSAKELERQLGVTYKCAWRIGHQLRELMAARNKITNPGPLSGHVEVDETYIGGKIHGKKLNKFRNKVAVVGVIERGGPFKGSVIADGKSRSIMPVVMANIAAGATVSTDKSFVYKNLSKLGFNHGAVNHDDDQWVDGIHHTNTIEGFWSHLKRGIRSTHAAVSRQHMQAYVDEFAFRFNNRHDSGGMFQTLLSHISKR